MTTGFESLIASVLMLIFSGIFSFGLMIVNFTSVGILTSEDSWFSDTISTWLSINTIVSFVTVALIFIFIIASFFNIESVLSCQVGVIILFWIAKFGLVIYGTYEYVTSTTSYEKTGNMSLAIIIMLWIAVAIFSLMSMKAVCT